MFFVLVRTWCCIELDRSRGNGVRVYKTGLVFATRPRCISRGYWSSSYMKVKVLGQGH